MKVANIYFIEHHTKWNALLYCWATNILKLKSSTKTEFLQITSVNNPPVDLSLTVKGNIIKCSDKVKDLGVLLDSKLAMVDNI